MDFCADLSTRFSGSLQISSDGLPAYKMAVGANFDLDRTSFAQLVKIYGQDEKGHDVCVGSRKEPVFGTPDIDLVSTSYVERSDVRQHDAAADAPKDVHANAKGSDSSALVFAGIQRLHAGGF